jgi:hypothetical protein
MPHRLVNPYTQFWDIVGTGMLPNGTINFFENTTTTAAEVFSDADLTTSIGSTITLDAGGRAREVYFDATLTIEVFDANGAFLRRVDNVTSIGSEGSSGTTVTLFDSIQDAIDSTTIIVDTVIETASYFDDWTSTTSVPRGGAFYEVVATGTFVPDELVNHTSVGTTTLLKFIPNHDDSINVFQAGAISDGVSNDQPQIQSALDLIGKLDIPLTADCAVGAPIILKDNNEFIIDGTLTRTFTRDFSGGQYTEAATIVNELAPASSAWQIDGAFDITDLNENIHISGKGLIQVSAAVSAAVVADQTKVAGPAIALLAAQTSTITGNITATGNINNVAFALWLFESFVTGLRVDTLNQTDILVSEQGIQIIGGRNLVIGSCTVLSGGDSFILGSNGNIDLSEVSLYGSTVSADLGFAITLQQNREGVTAGFGAVTRAVSDITLVNFSGSGGDSSQGVYQIKTDTSNSNFDTVRSIDMSGMALDTGTTGAHDLVNDQLVIANGGHDISIEGICPNPVGTLFDVTNTERMTLKFTTGFLQSDAIANYGSFINNVDLVIDGKYDCGQTPSDFLFVVQDGSYTFLGTYYDLEEGYDVFSVDPQTTPCSLIVDAAFKKLPNPTVVPIVSVTDSVGFFNMTEFNFADTAPDIWTGDSITVSGFTGDEGTRYNGVHPVYITDQQNGDKHVIIEPLFLSNNTSGQFTVETRLPQNIIARGDGVGNPGSNFIKIGGPGSDFSDYLKLIEDDVVTSGISRTGNVLGFDTVIVVPSKGTDAYYAYPVGDTTEIASSYGATTIHINIDNATSKTITSLLAPIGMIIPWKTVIRNGSFVLLTVTDSTGSNVFGVLDLDGANKTIKAFSYGFAEVFFAGRQWKLSLYSEDGDT